MHFQKVFKSKYSYQDATWIGTLRRFHFSIGLTANFFPTKHDERSVALRDLDLSQNQIMWLLPNATSLVLTRCWELNKMFENMVKSAYRFASLKSLTIASCFAGSKSASNFASSMNCKRISEPFGQYDLLPNLEELRLHDLMHLESHLELAGRLGVGFYRLRIIEVMQCSGLHRLLSYGDSMLNTEILEEIKVSFCDHLEELFQYTPPGKLQSPASVVPNLQIIELKNLRKLRTIANKKICGQF